MKIIILLLVLWNIWAFAVMGLDKYKAKKRHWRVPERHLLFMALAMGGLGILGGMLFFRHKTKHLKFVVGVPLLLLLNILFLVEGQRAMLSFFQLTGGY